MKAPKRSCRYSFCGMGRFPPVLMGCDATIVVVLSHLTLRGVSRVVYCFVLAKSESNSVLIAAKGGIGKPQCQWSCRSVSTCCVCEALFLQIHIYICVCEANRKVTESRTVESPGNYFCHYLCLESYHWTEIIPPAVQCSLHLSLNR